MDIVTPSSHVPIDAVAGRPTDALTQMVQHLMTHLRPSVSFERRHFQRTPIPYLLRLSPLDDSGNAISEQATIVVGRDLTPRGINFFHQQPLPYRRALVTLDHPQAGRFTMEVDINRCHFHRLGWYESGGRLMRAVELMLPSVSEAG